MNPIPKVEPAKIQGLPGIPDGDKHELNDKSWVVLVQNSDENQVQVYIFNNEQAPEDYKYADFKDFAELTLDDFAKLNKTEKHIQENIAQYTGTEVNRQGIHALCIDIYNGGLDKQGLDKAVSEIISGTQEVLKDVYEDLQGDGLYPKKVDFRKF